MNIFVCDENAESIYALKQSLFAFAKKYNVSLKLYTALKLNETILKKLFLVKLDFIMVNIDTYFEAGLEMIRHLRKVNRLLTIIFVTDKPVEIWRQQKISHFDVLLKPYEERKLEDLFQVVLIQAAGIKVIQNKLKNQTVSFVSDRNKYIVREEEIIFLRREGAGVVIATNAKDYIVYDTLKCIAKRLSDDFVTINRGILVNRRHITKISGKIACMSNNAELPISMRNYKNTVEQFTALYSKNIEEELITANVCEGKR